MSDVLTSLTGAFPDRYAIEREIGRGGMATVYLARDVKHDRPVAIKVLHPEFSESTTAERFLREIRIAASLRHPGILPVYDSGEIDGLLYYVMPYVSGESLRERLERERQLPVAEAVRITSELAAALEEAHGRGIVHRDVKPENVLFEGDQPQLMDFGVARAAPEGGGEKLTRTGVSVGTPHYMSPEQASGDAVDARSDVYALGCVLYEMLGGEPPYTGPTSQAIMARHAMAPVPDVRTLRPTVSEGVVAALERALAKVPADRYASAGAFAEALERGDEKLRRQPARRSPWRDVAIAAVVLLTAGGLYLATRIGEPPTEADTGPRVAVLPFQVTASDQIDTAVALGLFADVSDRLRDSGVRTLWPQGLRHYRDPESSVEEVYADMDPDIVWVTRVDTRGDSLVVRADLVDPSTQVSIDATSIVLPADALLDLVPRLSRWAAGVFGVEAVTPVHEPDPEARRAYVKARRAWWNFDLLVADSLLDLATALDPEYAEAWGLKALLDVQFMHGDWAPPCSMYAAILPAVKDAASRALRYDSTLIFPHVALGHGLWEHEFDWETARQEFLVALALDPDHPDANMFYGIYLMTEGRPDEAWEYMSRALTANAVPPGTHLRFGSLLARWVGHLPEAEQHLRLARIRSGPEPDPFITELLANNLRDQGRVEEAITLLLDAGRDTVADPLDDDPFWAIQRGNRAAVDRLIAEAVETESYRWASLIAYWDGRYDEALDYLERWWPNQLACPSRARVWLLADYPDLADRPRFQELMDVAGIPWRDSPVVRDLRR